MSHPTFNPYNRAIGYILDNNFFLQFVQYLNTLSDTDFGQAKRILMKNPETLNISAPIERSNQTGVQFASGLFTYCNESEYQELALVEAGIPPGPLKGRLWWAEMPSDTTPSAQEYWTWALTIPPGLQQLTVV